MEHIKFELKLSYTKGTKLTAANGVFNSSNNEGLILSILSAGVSRGRNVFFQLCDDRKDKSGEKLTESEEDLLEHRTDGTDAFDTLYIGCEKFPYHDTFSLSMLDNIK